MDIDDLLHEPATFAACEEEAWDAGVYCKVWEEPLQSCIIRLRKSGDWVQIMLPELIFKSKPGETVYDNIDIYLDKEEEEIQKWFGETSYFGVMGFCGCKKTDRDNTVEFIDLYGIISEKGHIIISRDGKPLRNSADGWKVGSVSTVITLIPQEINKDDDDEEPPNKAPRN